MENLSREGNKAVKEAIKTCAHVLGVLGFSLESLPRRLVGQVKPLSQKVSQVLHPIRCKRPVSLQELCLVYFGCFMNSELS